MVTYDLVLVVWHDAFSMNDGWMTVEQIDDEPCVVHTVGYLIPDSKKNHVVLAQSVNTNDGIDSVMAIPVAMVQRLTMLK
jgi:hypothetical protein